MAKLYFRYGCMGSSKTANALMVHYNYMEKGQYALLMKPSVDDREGADIVGSRMGLKEKATIITPETDILNFVSHLTKDGLPFLPDAIIIDEVQFLTEEQVRQLCNVVDIFDIPILCYGLRTNFKGELFPATRVLMALADSIEEIKTVCWCGRKATINARIIDGKVVYDGPEILIGGNDSYTALCRKHWEAGDLSYADEARRRNDIYEAYIQD